LLAPLRPVARVHGWTPAMAGHGVLGRAAALWRFRPGSEVRRGRSGPAPANRGGGKSGRTVSGQDRIVPERVVEVDDSIVVPVAPGSDPALLVQDLSGDPACGGSCWPPKAAQAAAQALQRGGEPAGLVDGALG